MPPNRSHIRLEKFGGQCLLGVTLCASACVLVLWAQSIGANVAAGHVGGVVLGVVVCVLSLFLVLGSIVYQIARLGYLNRVGNHSAAPNRELRHFYDNAPPRVAILIPSYKEDCGVVRRTLLSAALQDYPNRRVVLLIDDPPEPARPGDVAQLLAMRRLLRDLTELLAQPAARLREASSAFMRRQRSGIALDRADEAQALVGLFEEVAAWFDKQALLHECRDHSDAFFMEHILRRASAGHRATASELAWHAQRDGGFLTVGAIEQLYRRLDSLFAVRFSSFERKRYENLSHAPNKAMNLNSYIGLLGRRVLERTVAGRLRLEDTHPATPGSVEFADADYVLTLDADSILLSEYTLRLVHLMEQPANADVAVAQTPYSAFPGAASVLERSAGATTDIQYLIHQGFTAHGATFWVGANALLRKTALDEIADSHVEDGKRVHRYISDRTVIEDTESSVELISRGWRLINYPERLSFSATPPDFGALLIQRRRWANGGLLILPKLLRYLASLPLRPITFIEALLRTHYLTSIAGANVALLALLLYPSSDAWAQIALIISAIPYFLLYTYDLHRCGYRPFDMIRVYALNLVLVPVNLAGVLKSLQQAASGRKIPFGRTPKSAGRTATPRSYLVAEFALLAYTSTCAGFSFADSQWLHAAFGATTVALLSYGAVAFLGLRATVEDLARREL